MKENKNNVQMKGSTTMKEFNLNAFLTGNASDVLNVKKPVSMGLHHNTVVRDIKVIVETKDDVERLRVNFELEFTEGTTTTKAFFNEGALYAAQDIKKQLEDYEDYDSVPAFLNSVVGKKVTVYVFRKSYMDKKSNTEKTSVEYRFWSKVPTKHVDAKTITCNEEV